MLVFLNGQIIKEEEAKVSINDLSYQFGFGLFETIKCERGIPLFFEAHFKRLTQSARELGIQFPIQIGEIKEWIRDLLARNKLSNARLKLIISKRTEDKFNVSIIPASLEVLPKSYSLFGKVLSRDPKSISFKYKTTSRADSYFAYKKALEEGFNDVLYLNEKNELVECTRANIFLIVENKVVTPLLESGILPGVTRGKVLEIAKKENITLEEKNVHQLYLNKAKDVFITNAIVDIMPVSRIKLQDKEYNFSRDSITIKIKNAYDTCVQEYLRKSTSIVI